MFFLRLLSSMEVGDSLNSPFCFADNFEKHQKFHYKINRKVCLSLCSVLIKYSLFNIFNTRFSLISYFKNVTTRNNNKLDFNETGHVFVAYFFPLKSFRKVHLYHAFLINENKILSSQFSLYVNTILLVSSFAQHKS